MDGGGCGGARLGCDLIKELAVEGNRRNEPEELFDLRTKSNGREEWNRLNLNPAKHKRIPTRTGMAIVQNVLIIRHLGHDLHRSIDGDMAERNVGHLLIPFEHCFHAGWDPLASVHKCARGNEYN